MHRTKVMRKLLGQTPTIPIDSTEPTVTESPHIRPSASQNTIYSAGAPLTCLDRSPDGKRAIIAGPNTVKVLRVEGSSISEDFDLRTAIKAYAAAHDPSAASTEQLNIGVIKWSHGILDNTVVTASGNGRITVYDLNRIGDGLEVARISDHVRQVHQLAINPYKPNWLLSASQDGTIKSFDIRAPTQKKIGQLRFSVASTFKGNADAVRDVAWSPGDGMEFASSTDAGVVFKWDARKPNAPVLKLSAHTGACFAIAWHPDGEHLISGGLDQNCHIWNLSKSAERNQKPRYTFHTPAPVSTLVWRPSSWSASAQGRRAAQVTIAYDDSIASRTQCTSVHVWDIARPSIPYIEVDEWETAPRSILWSTKDLLWSVDSEGNFAQTDVAFVPKSLESRSLSNFSFSSHGDLLMMMEERDHCQLASRVRRSVGSQDASPSYARDVQNSLFNTNRSDSEDESVSAFLGARRRRYHERRQSDRATQFSVTSSTTTAMAESKVMSLTESIGVTGIYEPRQVMAFGRAPGALQKSIYDYYSNSYLHALERYKKQTNLPILERLGRIMEDFARYAAAVGHYRLAQTWRILALFMNKLLVRRAEYHRKQRLAPAPPASPSVKEQQVSTKSGSDRGMETPRKFSSVYDVETPRRLRSLTPIDSPVHAPIKTILTEDPESTSNVTTPLVRPQRDSIVHLTREAMHTPLAIENDPLDLPAAAHSTSPSPIPVPRASNNSQTSVASMEGYDFYDLEAMTAAKPYVAPQKKQPLRLEYSGSSIPQRIQPLRHDSAESFQMFSTSSDSQGTRFMSSSESEGRNSFPQNGTQDLKNRVADWESSFGSTSEVNSNRSNQANSISGSYRTDIGSMDRRTSDHLHRPPAPILRIQEASAPKTGNKELRGNLFSQTSKLPESSRRSQDPDIIEGDYEAWPDDPQFLIDALDPTVVVQRTLNYEAEKSAIHASVLILLLRPLLPVGAIDDYQAPAILRTYHQRLNSFKLFLEATLLRRLCVPEYPVVYAISQQNVTVGFFCTDCNKPLENDPLVPESQWKCPRCKQYMDSCPVCESRYLLDNVEYPEQDTAKSKNGLWWYCNGCGHGGHVTCMKAWHAGSDEYNLGEKHSDGCCPVLGCLHPCLPGKWRDTCQAEKAVKAARELEGLVRENSRGNISRGTGRGIGVRRDAREVNQSRAVEGVRLALNIGAINAAAGTSGNLERKKSVKLVAPGEESAPSKR